MVRNMLPILYIKSYLNNFKIGTLDYSDNLVVQSLDNEKTYDEFCLYSDYLFDAMKLFLLEKISKNIKLKQEGMNLSIHIDFLKKLVRSKSLEPINIEIESFIFEFNINVVSNVLAFLNK